LLQLADLKAVFNIRINVSSVDAAEVDILSFQLSALLLNYAKTSSAINSVPENMTD